MTRNVVIIAAVLAGLSSSACGDSPTGPSGAARVEAVVQDSESGTVTGSLAGNVFASIWNGSRWVDLGSPNGITITLQTAGRTTTVHGEQGVTPGSYTRVRLVFQGVTARLASGSRVGGATLTSDTTLRLGGSDQRAEMVVDVSNFVLEADASVRRTILFDLRSPLWITAAAVQSAQVEDAALQAAVTAETRLDRR